MASPSSDSTTSSDYGTSRSGPRVGSFYFEFFMWCSALWWCGNLFITYTTQHFSVAGVPWEQRGSPLLPFSRLSSSCSQLIVPSMSRSSTTVDVVFQGNILFILNFVLCNVQHYGDVGWGIYLSLTPLNILARRACRQNNEILRACHSAIHRPAAVHCSFLQHRDRQQLCHVALLQGNINRPHIE